MKEITDKYGLDLDAAWNKEALPHQGRHHMLTIIMFYLNWKDLIVLRKGIEMYF
ncbi:hypothetical protein SAMN04487866_1443 [Thermoactinomyces sp. DSM 45891]|nr:hypothetical protein SAMN04487866_1443 [Thermoactinomyces sp. DSM 45891]